MRTVAEFAATAAQLSPAQLRELRDAIDRLENDSRAFLLRTKRLTCRLLRLDDDEFSDLLERSLAIEDVNGYFLSMLRWRHDLSFPEVYLTLKELTGESGQYLDDWKSSFSFPFALDVVKGQKEFSYLLEVRNYRASLEFPIRRVVAPDDPRLAEGRIHPPFAKEFSRGEISELIAHLCAYLAETWETIWDRPQEPFLHRLACSGILFGYCGGSCFEEHYESDKACEVARKRYEKRIKRTKAALRS